MAFPAQGSVGRTERRDEFRRRLLTAITELTRSGESSADVSVERLATEAGLSRATFYAYFDGKGDLLRPWFAETLLELRQGVEGWLRDPSSPDELRAGVENLVTIFRAHAPLIAAMNDEATQDSGLRHELDQTIARVTRAIQSRIEVGQREGSMDPLLLPLETAAWFVWMIERGLNQAIATADDERVPALVDTLVRLIHHTLYSD